MRRTSDPDPGVVRALEQHMFSAWPAPEVEEFDGWRLHHGAGYTRRANSVNPFAPSTLLLDGKVAYAEQWYAARGARTIFRLTPATYPADLDHRLHTSGYGREAVTTVALRPLTAFERIGDVELETRPSREWIEAKAALSSIGVDHRTALETILSHAGPDARFASIREAGSIVGVGMGVAGGGLIGLYGLVTAPASRRRGHGRRITEALLAWGGESGAKTAYLQVYEPSSPEAVGLYASLGFAAVYRYWYRASAAAAAQVARTAPPSSA